MKLTNLVPMLTVTDMDGTVNTYHDVLGFECVNQIEGWGAVRKDGGELTSALPDEHVPFDKPHFTGWFYSKHHRCGLSDREL